MFSKEGARELDPDGIVEGEDPLEGYGEHAHAFFRRLAEYDYAGDIVVNGTYDPEKRWVMGFDELVGAHGGLGGPQTEPFLIYPSGLDGRGAEAGRLGGRAPLLEAAHLGRVPRPRPLPRARGGEQRSAGIGERAGSRTTAGDGA